MCLFVISLRNHFHVISEVAFNYILFIFLFLFPRREPTYRRIIVGTLVTSLVHQRAYKAAQCNCANCLVIDACYIGMSPHEVLALVSSSKPRVHYRLL